MSHLLFEKNIKYLSVNNSLDKSVMGHPYIIEYHEDFNNCKGNIIKVITAKHNVKGDAISVYKHLPISQ